MCDVTVDRLAGVSTCSSAVERSMTRLGCVSDRGRRKPPPGALMSAMVAAVTPTVLLPQTALDDAVCDVVCDVDVISTATSELRAAGDDTL